MIVNTAIKSNYNNNIIVNSKKENCDTTSSSSKNYPMEENTIQYICLCLWQTIKIFVNLIQEKPSSNIKKNQYNRKHENNPVPHRTKSKVIQVDKAWIRQSVQQKKIVSISKLDFIRDDHEEESDDKVFNKIIRSRNVSVPNSTFQTRRSQTWKRYCQHRRHSYPPFQCRLKKIDEIDDY